MGLLQKLKSLFGSDQKRQDHGRGSEHGVTVEREPAAESEHAVKGTGGQQHTGQPQGSQPQGSQPQGGQPASETADAGAGGQTTPGPSLDEIKGIGPTYADRLNDAGYGSVVDLADADPAEVAEAADTGEGRAADWIERAQNF